MTHLTAFTDARVALRQMARAPLFSGVVIAVIALGIGINSGLLTVLDSYAWRPAPGIARDKALARLLPTSSRGANRPLVETALSYDELVALRERHEVFRDVIAWNRTSLAADFGGGPEPLLTFYVSDDFFRVLGVALSAGTGLPGNMEQTAEPVAVISHDLWLSAFEGSPRAIGATIRVMNVPVTIGGVAPPRFVGVDVIHLGRPAIWLPLGARAAIEPGSLGAQARRSPLLRVVARLAPGVRPADVDRLTAAQTAGLARARELPEGARLAIGAERLSGLERTEGSTSEMIVGFFLVAALVVVVTCTNVSALLLGRAVARRREIGVRLSLGATRLRIVRQLLTESLVFAFAGALLGLLLYYATVRIAYATMPEAIYGLEPAPATFLFAAAFALVTTVAFGLAPALHASGADIGEVIKGSGRHAIRRGRLQAAFVVVQLACSQPVLVVTALVLVSMTHRVTEGVAPASLVTMQATQFRPAPAARNPEAALEAATVAARASLALIRQRLAELPGALSAAVEVGEERVLFGAAGGDAVTGVPIRQIYVTRDYFTTHGIPLLRGRALGIQDDQPGATAVVVNEVAARRLWPGEDPVGKRLQRRAADGAPPGPVLEVVGIAGRAPGGDREPRSELYVPLPLAEAILWEPLAPASEVTLVRGGWPPVIAVRTAGDARSYVPQIREAIREVEPYVALSDVRTLAEEWAGRQRQTWLANLAAFAVAAAALLLASLGLYAIIAFAVGQRTREIGVRLAIGAAPFRVVREFFRGGITVAAIGLAIGLPVTLAGIRLVKASVVGFTPRSVLAVVIVVTVLLGVAALASWLPARRAGRVDPLIALQSE